MSEAQSPAADPQALEAVRTFLSEVLRRLDPTARLSLRVRGRQLEVELRGALAFQGRESVAIQALEHLIDLVLRRQAHSPLRARLEIDGYRARRLAELTALAHELARKVQAEGRPLALEPMTSWERKAIHQALEDVPGVRTYSKGRLERHLVIEPVAANV